MVDLVNQPFTLEYICYAQVVWKNGEYKKLPPLMKQYEPNPYPPSENYIPKMIKKMHNEQQRHGSKTITYKTVFYKEFMGNILDEALHQTIRNRRCYNCWLKSIYPQIEEHPPKPEPLYDCSENYKTRHFPNYFFVNGEARERPPKRSCTLKKRRK